MADVTISQLPDLAVTGTNSLVHTNGITTGKATINTLRTALSIPNAQVNSDWNAASGVAQILNKPTIPTITNSFASNGYSRIGSLIIQWGQSPHPGGGNHYRTITFPLAFPSACLIVVVSSASSCGGCTANPGGYSWTRTNFQAYANTGESPLAWIALGY